MSNQAATDYTPHAIAERIAENSGPVQFEGDAQKSDGQRRQGIATPPVTDVGLTTGGTATTAKVKEANTPSSGDGVPDAQGMMQQTVSALQNASTRAQEVGQPYVQKVQEVAEPYVQKAKEVSGPYVNAAVEKASPVIDQAKQYASKGMQAATAELEKQGITAESTQQKLADVGQSLKDYSVVGQERAGQYLHQAVDQAKAIGQDGENKNVIASVFGTITLIWLAFGFSLTALLALGVAGTIAAILSRYSRESISTHQQSQNGAHSAHSSSGSGVETHYPRPSHPDASLNYK